MNILKDILESYLLTNKLKVSYNEKVKQSINKCSIDWDERALESSKSIIAAICFKESAMSLYEKSDNLIYPAIGYYYSLFHLSLALLKLDHTTKLKQLNNMHHSHLSKLINSKLVETKIISKEYLAHLQTLKNLRESSNYRFGFNGDLLNDLKRADDLTEKCFDEGLIFIHQILNVTNTLFRFQVSIGNYFGDDIIDTYLSGDEKENVWTYLAINSLTS